MKIIDDVEKNNRCTGCSACFNICPVNAITMKSDKKGFLVPEIDNKKCIHCGLCDKVCPSLNKVSRDEQYSIPKVYAAWNKDEEIRLKSSSGGVFSILAEHFLDKEGFVCGASFDSKNKLKHIIISDRKDLARLRGSKYVQSEVGDVYRIVKKLLEEDKWVLFSGVPCQSAGLRSFLKRDYEKLLIVDVVCHGVPSRLVLERYIEEIERKNKVKLDKINFRNKSTGWKDYSFTLSGEEKDYLKEKSNENIFFDGFLENLYLNNICTNCPYSEFPKYSDITLGDYWGIGDYNKNLDDDKGTSIVTLNNKKGAELFDLLKDQIFYKKIPERAYIPKLLAISLPCSVHPNRESFFNNFGKKENISEIIQENLIGESGVNNSKNVAIFNMRFPTTNYGAILQSYALFKTVTFLGYEAKVINFISKELDRHKDKMSSLNLDKFRENNISYTLPCYSDEELIRLNRDFSAFIVGSDQVWNYNYLKGCFSDDITKYFLDFVIPSKKKISYAASFAENHWKGSDSDIRKVRKSLEEFAAISVRETSGVDICQQLFNVKVENVLDPTFLLGESDYQKIIDTEANLNNEKNYIAFFTLDEELEETILKDRRIKRFVSNKDKKLINIRGYYKNVLGDKKFIYNSVPQWLKYIKESDFVITDSYHCAIFAIIFKKDFFVVERNYAGNERFNSLFSILEIKGRIFEKIEDIDFDDIPENKINYTSLYKNLEESKKKSLRFLKESLGKNLNPKQTIYPSEEEEINRRLSIAKLKSKCEVLESENRILNEELQRFISENQNLLNTIQELILKNETLAGDIGSYQSSKTFRYANKLKKILAKFGLKRFRV